MNGKKNVRGKKYIFDIDANIVGQGGNGSVYEISNIRDQKTGIIFERKCVCKVFEKTKKLNRYERFKTEIEYQNQCGIKGVMPVYDFYLPENISKNDKPWYIMPKADKYANKKKSFKDKLSDMISLASIISDIHKDGRAHRDIKPYNILQLDGEIYLCDFGLVWNGMNITMV